MKILLLDDDQSYGAVLKRQLTRKQFDVCYISEGAELLDQCESFKPDCVLLDLNLGNSSSLPYISNVRQRLPNAKILMVTGYASIATTVSAIKAGADDYLPKPIDLTNLIAAIGGQTENVQNEANTQVMSPERLEWEHIQRVLAECDGNISETARQLNMHRRTLQRKLAKKPVGC